MITECVCGSSLFATHKIHNRQGTEFWSCFKCELSYIIIQNDPRTLVPFTGPGIGEMTMEHPKCECGCTLFAVHPIYDTVDGHYAKGVEFWNCLKCVKRLVWDRNAGKLIDVLEWLKTYEA